ncbi:DUF937 domain-containing protein [Ancylobacter terrae]|uniref:DUF937 domain-containing protein n=1 Tax=Ancylobacter sp. sgz301288 TaxID=3342077 RepID=UPI00385AAE5F
MINLQDLFTQAQQGQAIDNLARSYGIAPAQAQAAVEAMLPAFALGLERSTQSAQGFAGLLGAMSRNPYAEAFANPALGFGPQTRAEGNDALAALFGSPEVSRAVAAQAAATTGLSSALLKQMLPAIAALVLGGLMKQGGGSGGGLGDLLGGMLGGSPAGRAPSAGAGSGNPLQDILGGMLGGGGPMGGSAPRGGAGAGSGNPLQDMLEGMLGGGAGAGAPDRPRDVPTGAGSGNPLQDMLEGMFGGGTGAGAPDRPRDAPTGGAGSGNPLQDMLEGMFGGGARSSGGDSGRGAAGQDPRLQPFQDIFDQFFNGRSGSR